MHKVWSIRTIVLVATVVYELVGPVIAKAALQRAGEIKPDIFMEEGF
ncbi:hypothetical protein KVG29_07230 [Caldicoprobacter algeriensis]|nr:hypothetical protein [Caldicoprobacter algeriensis]MCM8901022.1 hypothetical protein [Caldicoprobacter algeriensis]